MRKGSLFIILLCIFSVQSLAGKGSLSYKLKKQAVGQFVAAGAFVLISIPLNAGTSSVLASIFIHEGYKDLQAARLYKSAFILKSPSSFDEKKIRKANKRVDKFYNLFTSRYRLSHLSKDEIITALAFFYENGMSSSLISNKPLALFPDGTLKTYQNYSQKIGLEEAAQKIRQDKNKDSDDSESLPVLGERSEFAD